MLLAALFMPLAAVFYFASVKGTGVEPIEFYKWTAFSYTPWISCRWCWGCCVPC